MKFSRKSSYGLRAMLILADLYGQRSVSTSQIAASAGVSRPFLEQILHLLKRKLWIRGVRGPSGGYVLAKKPSDIRLAPLLRDLEGKLLELEDSRSSKPARLTVPTLASALFWKNFSEKISETLNSTSLKDLLDKANRERKSKNRLHFNI